MVAKLIGVFNDTYATLTRPYRLGNRKVDQQTYDREVKRLLMAGLSEVEIARRFKQSRWTVGRSIKRVALTPQETTERQWAALTKDQFYSLPEIAPWVESMRIRRVGQGAIRAYVNIVKSVADGFQIYPSMLDVGWCKKWLALPEQQSKSLAQLRDNKIALRQWLKYAFKMSDMELAEAGFDAKHYEVGKWSHVRLSEEQIGFIDQYLAGANGCVLARWAFNFGIDTCSTADEMRYQLFEYYNDMGKLISVQIKRPKVKSYFTGYVRRHTYELAKEALKLAPLTDQHIDLIRSCLRSAYVEAGLYTTQIVNGQEVVKNGVPYFFDHPIHSLRHCGAQRYLEKTNWNRTAAAKLGHWKAEITLELHYGDMPGDVVERIFQGMAA